MTFKLKASSNNNNLYWTLWKIVYNDRDLSLVCSIGVILKKTNFFLANPEHKPLTDDELMALALENKTKAEKSRNKKQVKSCGCCPADERAK